MPRPPSTPGPHPLWRHRSCTSKLVDANRALFEYTCQACGHTWQEVLTIGPTGHRKPADAEACRLMDRVWGGYKRMNNYCPKCSFVGKRR